MLFLLLLLADPPPAVTDFSQTLSGLSTVPVPIWGVAAAFFGALSSVSSESNWSIWRRASATFFGVVGGWSMAYGVTSGLGIETWALPVYYFLGAMGYGLTGGFKTISHNFKADPIGTIKQLVLLKTGIIHEKLTDAGFAGTPPKSDGDNQP